MEKILVTEQERNDLQRLSIEVESRKDLMAFMIQNNMNLQGEKFKEYEKDYKQFFFEYDKAKNELEKKYVLPVIGEKEVRWQLDFNTCEISFE